MSWFKGSYADRIAAVREEKVSITEDIKRSIQGHTDHISILLDAKVVLLDQLVEVSEL